MAAVSAEVEVRHGAGAVVAETGGAPGGPDGGGRAAHGALCVAAGLADTLPLIVLVAELEDGLDLHLQAVDVVVDEALRVQLHRVILGVTQKTITDWFLDIVFMPVVGTK